MAVAEAMARSQMPTDFYCCSGSRYHSAEQLKAEQTVLLQEIVSMDRKIDGQNSYEVAMRLQVKDE